MRLYMVVIFGNQLIMVIHGSRKHQVLHVNGIRYVAMQMDLEFMQLYMVGLFIDQLILVTHGIVSGKRQETGVRYVAVQLGR